MTQPLQSIFVRAVFALLLFGLAVAAGAMLRENPRDSLERLRGEVDSLSTVLATLKADERSLDRRISTLDQQIATRQRLIRELDTQRDAARAEVKKQDRLIDRRKKDIAGIEVVLAETERDVQQLQQQVARRYVHLYKQGAQRTLSYLLTANTPGEFLRRQVYVQRIRERDKDNLDALAVARDRHQATLDRQRAAVTSLREARAEKAARVKQVDALVAEAAAERERLKGDRNDLAAMMSGLQQDRELVLKRIRDRKAAMAEVETWIANLERQRVNGGVQEVSLSSPSARVLVRDVPSFSNFESGRGRLPWPVEGTVSRRFGMETNQLTGTVTENPGIDISTREGAEILAVQEGVCTRITYIRGFGTTLLLSHERGYYTVYAHLASVWVSQGERVDAGRVLGTVGPPDGGGAPRLHFQVWHKQNKQDPLAWLSS